MSGVLGVFFRVENGGKKMEHHGDAEGRAEAGDGCHHDPRRLAVFVVVRSGTNAPLMRTMTCPGNLGKPDASAASLPWEIVRLLPFFRQTGGMSLRHFSAMLKAGSA